MKLRVTDRQGLVHTLDAVSGWRVMEIIRDHALRDPALGIKAECGGACACATCHVYLDPDWAGKVPPPTEEETDRLDDAFDIKDTSRLSCQIIMDDTLDGLALTLAVDSAP